MKLFFPAIFLACVLSISCLGQDTLRIDSELSIETKGQHNIAALNRNFDCINCLTGQVEDNPLHHLALYAGITHDLTINNKFTFETGLFMEERSHSGGNNTLSNLILYPKLTITAADSLNKGRIKYLLRGGDLWDEDIGDFLRIYNLDYHGLIAKVYIGKYSLGFMTIGDLSLNVGLDLHQLYKFTAAYNNDLVRHEASVSVNELVTAPRGTHPASTDVNITNYLQFRICSDLDLEGQLDTRINSSIPTSIACGVRLKYTMPKFKVTSAIRYFNQNFNVGYNGMQPRYGTNRSFVGPQLYPIKNFYRNLSQWALYTHSHQSSLLTMEIAGSWSQKVYNNISGFLDFDVNYIYNLEGKTGSIYPIYNTGIQFNFISVFYGRISLTNKHIDLRSAYQTMSISKMPFLSLSFALQLDKIKLKTIYVKS